jgi:hypothetical protein
MWTDFAEAFFGDRLEPEEVEAEVAEPARTLESPRERIEVADLTEDQLRAFEGRHYNAELGTIYTLRVEDGTLMAHHRKNESFSLTHQQDDESTSAAWYMGQINSTVIQREELTDLWRRTPERGMFGLKN